MKSLENIFGGFFHNDKQYALPRAQRVEEIGAVQQEVVRQKGKPNRHIYQVNRQGREVMLDLLRDFPPEIAKRDA